MKRWDTWLAVFFFGLIVWLMWGRVGDINWQKVGTGFAVTPWYVLLATALLTAVSYAIFCTFDDLGLRISQRKLSRRTSFTAAFVCYASNFNLGSIVGGFGMRLKLYTDLGVEKASIGRLIALSTLSNWIGYAFFGGIFFIVSPPVVTDEYGLAAVPWRLVGGVGLVFVGLYLVLMRSERGSLSLFGHEIPLPGQKEGFLRLGLGVLNWVAVSTLLAVIFSWSMDAPVSLVISAYLVAAVAGVLTHIPGGLGVFEAIFLAALGPTIGNAETLVGVLTFRAVYYLMPLMIAIPAFFWLKFRLIPRQQKTGHKEDGTSQTVVCEQLT